MIGMPESWQLKIERAEQKLVEIKLNIAAFTERHPYEAVRVRERQGKQDVGHWRLRFTEQPDPILTAIIGEFLYDLRSALDHIAVAMAPRNRRNSAFFPIEPRPIWDKVGRRYIVREREGRRRFKTAIRGMPDPAVAIIKKVQPYNFRNGSEPLAIELLNKLENLDKHRELVTLANLLTDITVFVVWIDSGKVDDFPAGDKADGTNVFHWNPKLGPVPPQSEMKVQLTGTAQVAVKIGGVEGYGQLPDLLETMLVQLRDHIFPALEPFIQA